MVTMGPNDPNFVAKLFSLSKHLEQLMQVPDWVMFCECRRHSRLYNSIAGKVQILSITDDSNGPERRQYFGNIDTLVFYILNQSLQSVWPITNIYYLYSDLIFLI